jgi:hypothetical protein
VSVCVVVVPVVKAEVVVTVVTPSGAQPNAYFCVLNVTVEATRPTVVLYMW